jgi:hypothetical protein
MNGQLLRLTNLQTLQNLGGLTASLLAIAWTLTRWGVTEALSGTAPLVLILACVCAILAALVLIAWVTRKWGAGNALRGVAPWLAVAACLSVTLAGLALLAAVLQTHGWAGTLCTSACLLWLLDFAARRFGWVWKHVRQRGPRRAVERGPVAETTLVQGGGTGTAPTGSPAVALRGPAAAQAVRACPPTVFADRRPSEPVCFTR